MIKYKHKVKELDNMSASTADYIRIDRTELNIQIINNCYDEEKFAILNDVFFEWSKKEQELNKLLLSIEVPKNLVNGIFINED